MGVNDSDSELYEAIEDLEGESQLAKGMPAYGIAQQVIWRGYDSLTPKQRALYDAVVIPLLERRDNELRVIHTINSHPL